jgi:hypothetical protein
MGIINMESDSKSQTNEKTITKRQYIAFFVGMILFIPTALISANIFHTPKYGMFAPIVAMVYISVSSMTNRISILRTRGRLKPSRDKQALAYGAILLAVAIFAVIAIFTPSLSKIFFPF